MWATRQEENKVRPSRQAPQKRGCLHKRQQRTRLHVLASDKTCTHKEMCSTMLMLGEKISKLSFKPNGHAMGFPIYILFLIHVLYVFMEWELSVEARVNVVDLHEPGLQKFSQKGGVWMLAHSHSPASPAWVFRCTPAQLDFYVGAGDHFTN